MPPESNDFALSANNSSGEMRRVRLGVLSPMDSRQIHDFFSKSIVANIESGSVEASLERNLPEALEGNSFPLSERRATIG